MPRCCPVCASVRVAPVWMSSYIVDSIERVPFSDPGRTTSHGGAGVIQELMVLLSSSDMKTRQAGANALEYTHAREAVSALIALLLDSDANVHQTAVSGLALLTHLVVSGGNQWADVTVSESALSVHQK